MLVLMVVLFFSGGGGDVGFDVLFGDFCVVALFGVRDFRGVPLLGGVVHGAFVDSD